MRIRDWLRPSHHMVVIFAAVAVASVGALALLSWQLIEQDRLLEIPRQRGVLEAAADDAVRAMGSALDRLGAILTHADGTVLPGGVTAVAITSTGTTSVSAALPYVPTRVPLREVDERSLSAATTVEFRTGGRERALAAYGILSNSPDRAVRATALNRMAALQRKSGDLAGALRTYDALSPLDDVGVGGLPGGLVAAVGRATALHESERNEQLLQAAATLARDLARGRWPLTVSEFDFYSAQVSSWLRSPAPGDPDALARADAVNWLWQQRASLPAAGRKVIAQPRGSTVVVWRAAGDGLEAVVGGPAFLTALVTAAVPSAFAVGLRDSDGRDVFGMFRASTDVATRVASETVPWVLQLSPGKLDVAPTGTPPRRLLFLVIGLTVLVLGAGWYFIARARGRELVAARLQNDFVASVSHEFRSPLTSLAHVSELLAQNRLPTDVQKRRAYDVLVGDTARLRDMVEHLLDFGRFEAGTVTLRLERVDVGAAVAAIVDDARRRVATLGYTIDFSPPAEPILAEVDAEAFGRALWNLIDNAVKYSPDCKTVWVTLACDADRVAIAVRDEGIGIPRAEQPAVFQRFVRGEESRARRITGTGIGLTLVRQIVDAHGGEIELTSTVGEGSRFVVRLRAMGDLR